MYYLHRISHHKRVAYPLLERGILSIGWSDFATPEFVCSHEKKGWKEVPEAIEQEWGKMRSRFALQRFLQMDVGDRVVIPSWWGTFHVYEVSSEKRLIAGGLDIRDVKTWDDHDVRRENGQLFYDDKDGQRNRIDLGFFREVDCVVRDVPRSGYADNSLIARLKVRQTNVEIGDIRMNVDEAVARWERKKPIDLGKLIKERCADEVLDLITKKLDPDRLEKLIAWYFRRIGASSVDLPAKNESGKEGDADIVATFEPIRTIIYVQAKHHDETTDDWAVEQIASYVENKIHVRADDYTRIPWVVSTAREFSPKCRERAEQDQVFLVNGRELAERMLEAGTTDLSKLQK